RPVRITGAEAILQKIPVDRARKFHERAIHIGDLVEPRLEQIILPVIPPLPRSHRITLRCIATAKRITPKAPDQFARKPIHSAKNRRIRCHEYAKTLCLFSALWKLHARRDMTAPDRVAKPDAKTLAGGSRHTRACAIRHG